MPRLVDYVVLVAYDFDKATGSESQGRIIHRFPSKSWSDYPYDFHLEAFCQPCGWRLETSRPPPNFFVAYLTDMAGNSYFAACLIFHEAVTPQQLLTASDKVGLIHPNGRLLNNSNPMNGGTHPLHSFPRLSPASSSLPSSESLVSSDLGVFNNRNRSSAHKVQSGFDQGDPNLVRPAELYAPKCLVLLARHQHFDVLKNSLSLLYTVFSDSLHQYSLEQMIATMLGSVDVPPTGGPRITFSLGAGDRQTIQPAHCDTIPVTHNCVALLFKHLGVHNVILLFSAILSDQKILLCSRSLNRLTRSCQALTAILYPLKYGHTFVPILPKRLTEYLNAPTPFLYGIHSSYRHMLPELVDVFVADLDGGSVACPDNIPVPQLPEPYFQEVVDSLFQILNPELFTSDYMYPPKPQSVLPDLRLQDKQLRAVFIRLFASLFSGYRSCLSITRIHPQPVLHFNQSLFLMLRTISVHNEFFERLLSSMRFQQFILERGPPFRVCDVFDEMYDAAQPPTKRMSSFQCVSSTDEFSPTVACKLSTLSQKLLENECSDKPVEHVLPDEAVEAHKRIHQTPFPTLDSCLIDQLITEAAQKRNNKTAHYYKQEPRFVPQGLILDRQLFKAGMFPDKNRVIREFIADIFNRHITEALKRRNTIRHDLKSRPIRRLFVDELQRYVVPVTTVSPNEAINDLSNGTDRGLYEQRAMLTWEQFELIVDLLDEALCQESQSEDSGIAPIVMELSTKFTTEVNNVRYYANMAHQIQRHAIWEQMSFWENVFNEHVNNQMRQLYLHFSEQDAQRLSDSPKQTVTVVNSVNHGLHRSPSADGQQLSRSSAVSSAMQLSNGDRVITVGPRRKSLSSIQQPSYTANMSTLEIAAEEMRIGHSRSKEVQTTLESQEESTVYAQILHFINLIVNIRIPISVGAAAAGVYGDPGGSLPEQYRDVSAGMHEPMANGPSHTDRYEVNVKKSKATALERAHSESLGQDRHTSPGDHRYGHVRGGSTRVASALEHIARLEAWLRRFVEKVTDENNLSSSRIAAINEKIEGIIEGHLLNLETIYPEVKNIPKAKKPEIASPTLLTNEIAIPIGGYDCVRCQLLVDGRLERTDWQWLDTAGDLSNNSQAGSLSERLSVNSPIETEVEVDAMLRPLLPAQGALFVTNYRIIFTGVPKDPYQSNKVIIRSFPIAALHSIKKLGIMRITTIFPATTSAQPNLQAPATKSATMFIGKRNRGQQSATNSHGNKRRFGRGSHGDSSLDVGGRRGLVRIDENLDIINVRALTLQLLKLGFDPDEISQDTRDELRGLLLELRYPVALRMGFNRLSISPCIQQTGSEATPMTRERGGSHGSFSNGSYSKRVSGDRKENTVFPRTIPPGSIGRTRKLQLKDGSFRTAEYGSSAAPLASLAGEFRYSEESASAILTVLANATPHKCDPRLRSLLINSPGYLDMARFGLSSAAPGFTDRSSLGTRSSVTGSSTVYTGARLVAYNVRYELTKSYPALLVIPQTINQICLTKVSRSYRHGRFPVITWQHPTTGAYLLRGSGFHSKSILGALKQVGSSGPAAQQGTDKDIGSGESGEQSSTHTSTSKEHARYLLALVDMSFSAMAASGAAFKQSTNCFAGNEGTMSTTNVSTIASPASDHSGTRQRRAAQAADGLRTSSGKTRSLGRLAGLTLRHHRTVPSPSGSVASGLDDDLLSTNSASHLNIRGISPMAAGIRAHGAHRMSTMQQRVVSLCVLGEKSMMKTLAKQSNLRSVEFVPVDFVSQSQIADSFKNLFKACLPTEASKSFAQTSILAAAGLASVPVASQSTGQENDAAGNAPASAQSATTTSSTVTTMHMAIHDSRWLLQLQSLLQLSGAVVDLLDIQGVTVAVCIEDGTDAVTQVVALAQVMLDPIYRTLAGFWALIEKEWLLFGHPFNQRLNQTSATKSEQVSPVFLQFLDAVHQLLRQFPVSFEFNDFFLQFLAYHHISNRFYNFKYDCELDRSMAWLSNSDGLQSARGSAEEDKLMERFDRFSIWSYIQKQHAEWPVFFNFRYSQQMGGKILRPVTNLASLDIWKFYLHEDLATGPVYDLDHFSPSYRKQTNRPYEPILRQGFNNTHVEQVYAVLGLREGEEAIGWQAAWEQAQMELTNYTQKKAVRKRIQRRNQPKHTTGSGISPRTSKSREISNADRLTITVNYRDGSEPASSSVNPAKTATPRRAVSGPLIESDVLNEPSTQTCNHTTLTPKGNTSIQLDEGKDVISECSDADLSVRGKVGQVININLANGEQVIRSESDGKTHRIHRPFSDSSERSIDPQRVTINTLVFEPYSEDEAFHEENGVYIDDDELSSEYTSSDDCLAARSAALTYHRVATLQRLNNRTLRDVCSDVLSQPSVETGLSSGFGYETDSLASGSVYSSSATMPTHVPVHPSPTEVTASNLMFATPHQFTATNLSMSNARCQYCKNFLLSLGTGRAVARCTNCAYLCHEKCAPFVPKNCRTLPRAAITSDANRNVDGVAYDSSRLQLSGVTEEEHSLGLQPDRARLGGILSPKPPWRNSRDGSSRNPAVQIQDKRIGAGDRTVQLTQTQPEHPLSPEIRLDGSPPSHLVSASYYGVLHKMGHRKLLQQWKQRFFVLDTNRHQLRYYDTELDEVPRGRIDLQEVRAVRLVRNFAPHQRRVADCSVFELETNARTYRFAADSVTQANEWIERIQNTIQ
ncbi:hypothetical protein P879_03099 [Paragonimus westermani]|uniref:Myotubularin-related protein 13 n=1 Tax=Paragonimus westermani TaxID=34504 RepID=A0A8T0D182_9TREM|nr:hypothetical protein P879_03099 [Paragonimus westermani]